MADPLLFWTKAAAIGQIAGAVATAAAVIVTLWVVITERREKLSLRVGVRRILSELEDYRVISFEVTNLGLRSVRVTNFGWLTGWYMYGPKLLRFRGAVQTFDPALPGTPPPMNLDAGRKASSMVSVDSFFDGREAVVDLFGQRRLPLLGSRWPRVYAAVYTDRGTRLIVRVEKNLEAVVVEKLGRN